MPTSAPGNRPFSARRASGVTLIELLVVMVLIARSPAPVGLARPHPNQARPPPEADRPRPPPQIAPAQALCNGPVRQHAQAPYCPHSRSRAT